MLRLLDGARRASPSSTIGIVTALEECRQLCHDLLGEVLLLRERLDDLTNFAESEVAEKVALQDELAELRRRSGRRGLSFLRRTSRLQRRSGLS